MSLVDVINNFHKYTHTHTINGPTEENYEEIQ